MIILELLIILAAVIFLHRQLAAYSGLAAPVGLAAKRPSPQLQQMVEYADRLYRERKWLAAEKAYLKVLNIDHKNATAYTHLGIIYSTQKNLADAIECFILAARLKPSSSTFQNLGLAYYENHNYIKSIAAFEKANSFDVTAAHYMGISKAYKKLNDSEKMLEAIERAAELEQTPKILHILAEGYEDQGRTADATTVYSKILEIDPSDRLGLRWMAMHGKKQP